jgi:hypothetical protein
MCKSLAGKSRTQSQSPSQLCKLMLHRESVSAIETGWQHYGVKAVLHFFNTYTQRRENLDQATLPFAPRKPRKLNSIVKGAELTARSLSCIAATPLNSATALSTALATRLGSCDAAQQCPASSSAVRPQGHSML